MSRPAWCTFWEKATILYADLFKVHGTIPRFSEDISPSLNRSALGDGLVVPSPWF